MKSNVFSCVIEKVDNLNAFVIDTDVLKSVVEDLPNLDYYSFILHDKDVNVRPHFHLVLRFRTSYEKKSVLSHLASCLKCNMNIISVRISNSCVSSVRYLLHFGVESKYQYPINDIITNSNGDTLNYLYCDYDIDNLTFTDLNKIIQKGLSLKDIYSELGLKNAVKYRHIINDLYKERFIK